MSDERSAFEAGFLAEQDTPTKRTGEYHLGDASADILAQQHLPELQPPDELTVKRRMRQLRAGTPNKRRLQTRVYPLATAAVVVLAVIVGITQFPPGSTCGELGDVAVLSCGANHAATLESIDRSYPGTSLSQALRARPPVGVPVHRLGQSLTAVEASFAIVEVEAEASSDATHGLVLATHSEQEFDRVQRSLAENLTTQPVADELARLKQQEQPSWDSPSPEHMVVSLVNLN